MAPLILSNNIRTWFIVSVFWKTLLTSQSFITVHMEKQAS